MFKVYQDKVKQMKQNVMGSEERMWVWLAGIAALAIVLVTAVINVGEAYGAYLLGEQNKVCIASGGHMVDIDPRDNYVTLGCVK